jgi:hypothetical protein
MPHKQIQNHKFETGKSFKVQVFSFKRRQKTSRQKKLDQKLLPPKSTTRVSYLPSAGRLFICDLRSTIHDPPLLSHSCSFASIRGSKSSFSLTAMAQRWIFNAPPPNSFSKNLAVRDLFDLATCSGGPSAMIWPRKAKMTGRMAIFFLSRSRLADFLSLMGSVSILTNP